MKKKKFLTIQIPKRRQPTTMMTYEYDWYECINILLLDSLLHKYKH